MKARGAAVQGTLAVLGLVAAYATWQRQPEKGAGGDVVVLDIGRNDLQRVRYLDGPKSVDLERRSDGPEKGLWIHLSTRDSPDAGISAPDAGIASSPSEHKSLDRDLRANDVAEKLFDKFTPLETARARTRGVEEEVGDLCPGRQARFVRARGLGSRRRSALFTERSG